MPNSGKKPKLLLHICCAGCGVHVAEELAKDYQVSLYFYNPGIFPKEEYDIRLEEAQRIAAHYRLELFTGKYHHEEWLGKVKGREKDEEGGGRCLICYRDRMLATAAHARMRGDDFFTTTLTVSPHKKAALVNQAGEEAAELLGVKFLAADFKKRDGYKKSCILSHELGLYRQTYCGCEFSMVRDI